MRRYNLPKINPNQTNLWFSFDYGQVHIVHFSSEHSYSLGSQQYDYLEEDLKNARNNPNIEWIIVGVHRAFYSSLDMEYSNVTGLAFHL
jgi:acid phosphatase type 7